MSWIATPIKFQKCHITQHKQLIDPTILLFRVERSAISKLSSEQFGAPYLSLLAQRFDSELARMLTY
jgi:hypothetical protein